MEYIKLLAPDILALAAGLRMTARVIKRGGALKEFLGWLPFLLAAVAWTWWLYPEKFPDVHPHWASLRAAWLPEPDDETSEFQCAIKIAMTFLSMAAFGILASCTLGTSKEKKSRGARIQINPNEWK